MKRVAACIVLSVFFKTVLSQYDSLGYGARKWYASAGPVNISKTRKHLDSFGYRNTMWTADAGMYFRRSRILRPFAELGAGYGRELVTQRISDSSLKLMAPSEVNSLWLQPAIGAEVNPSETWYFRLSAELPLRLTYKFRNPDLLERFGLAQGEILKFQKYDLRYGVEVGRSLLRRRLELYGTFHMGGRYLFNVYTFDGAKAFAAGAGIRYHFGSF